MEIPRHWRLKAERYRMEGSLCPACGLPTFPPRPVCPHCTEKLGSLSVVLPSASLSIHNSENASHMKYEIIERVTG